MGKGLTLFSIAAWCLSCWNLDVEERYVRFPGKTTLNVDVGLRLNGDLAVLIPDRAFLEEDGFFLLETSWG